MLFSFFVCVHVKRSHTSVVRFQVSSSTLEVLTFDNVGCKVSPKVMLLPCSGGDEVEGGDLLVGRIGK